jgi:hypothetical protein
MNFSGSQEKTKPATRALPDGVFAAAYVATTAV